MPRLRRSFFSRPADVVAGELVGCTVRRRLASGEEVTATLVEVEAYLGRDDPASHAFRGPTRRAAIMFGQPGHLYVYLSYGMHVCANIVAHPIDPDSSLAGAVLLRAAMVDAGESSVRLLRERPELRSDWLLRGPGNLARGLGLALSDNGLDLCTSGALSLNPPRSSQPSRLIQTPRVGISQARDVPLRFAAADHPAVSGPRPSTGGILRAFPATKGKSRPSVGS